MFAKIWQLIETDPGVIDHLDDRVYSFGMAPEDTVDPYATWSTITGSPENYLGQIPDTDSLTLQFDVWGSPTNPRALREAASALGRALERYGHITSYRGESVDPETKRRRISFDFELWQERD